MAPHTADVPFFVQEGTDLVVFEDRRGNEIHLATVVRKVTNARPTHSGNRTTVQVEKLKLYDALGLLRGLHYDVDRYNEAMAAQPPPAGADDAARQAWSTARRVGCYRLLQQASSLGARLPSGGVGHVVVRGLAELIAFVEDAFADQIADARRAVSEGSVHFDSLAEFFLPGRDVVEHGVGTGLFGVPMGSRVRSCYFSRSKTLFGEGRTFYVALEFVVSVGSRFCLLEQTHLVGDFSSARSIRSGEDFTEVSPAMRTRLLNRGRVYERIATKATLMEHTPMAFIATTPASGPHLPMRAVGGRMMVDTAAALLRGVHVGKGPGSASEAVTGALKAAQHRGRGGVSSGGGGAGSAGGGNGSGGGDVGDDGDVDNMLHFSEPLPADLAWRTWPTVAGFSFAAKRWGTAVVDGLSDVRFDDGAFGRLVLPESRKRLIEALVLHTAGGEAQGGGEAHGGDARAIANVKAAADVIQGKGEGSVFLLHGPPGVGKTLTAEAIAELLHRPLYVVSMGELGTTPEQLERHLQDVFALCAPWRALVLIDEAEMLLERRSKDALVRNAMVCVMLRLLEYYAGVLFLTSNRVKSLDPAFQSRVQCALKYDPLDAPARAKVWVNLLERAGADTTALDVATLARHELNGRQIKNALQLALALAQRDGERLRQQHLDETVCITREFVEDVLHADDWEAGDVTDRAGAHVARGGGRCAGVGGARAGVAADKKKSRGFISRIMGGSSRSS